MAKSTRVKASDAVTTAADSAPKKSRTDASTNISESDIARRAYDLYLARGCGSGHQLEDWLQAERELRQSPLATIV